MKEESPADPHYLIGEGRLELVIGKGQADGLKADEVARELYSLHEQGRVRLSQPNPPKNFLQYLMSIRGLRFFGILVLIASDALLIYAITPYEMVFYLKYLVGSTFVLYMPGYVVVEAVYHRRDDLDELETDLERHKKLN